MHVTCEFGISGASRLTCRCVRILECANHLHVHCTARALYTLAPFFIQRQVGLAKMHPCTEFGVASLKFTFPGGPHVKTASSPLARAAGTPLKRHPQWILSWCSTRVTCDFGFSGAPRLTCRAVRKILVDLHAAARATCHVLLIDPKSAPSSFRRIGESNGASPVSIGPAVLVLFTKVLGHSNLISEMPQLNSFQPTHYA